MRFIPRRRWLQVSLRTFLLATLGICLWMGIWADRARRQERTVRQLAKLNCSIGYRHEFDSAGKRISNPVLPGPAWLRKLIGNHAFFQVYKLTSANLRDEDLLLVGQLSTLEELQFSGISDAGLANLSGLSKLKRIDISSAGITNLGLAHLRGMPELQELSLNETTVSDEGLRHLAPLSKLKKISLNTTQVTDKGKIWLEQQFPGVRVLPPFFVQESEQEIIQQLVKSGARFVADREGWVAVVTLEGHGITDETLAIVCRLEHLQQLRLNGTLVSAGAIKRLLEINPKVKIDPPIFENSTENEEGLAVLRRINANTFAGNGYVRKVNVFDEQLTDDDLRSIAKLSRLEDIVVASSPHITSAGLAHLRNCSTLKSLTIARSPLSNDALSELAGLTSLEFFSAYGPAITDEGLAYIAELKPLKYLGIRDSGIAGPGLKLLSNLPNLSRLALTGDKSAIDDDGLQYLTALPQLRELNLSNTKISDAGLSHLQSLPDLQTLHLTNTHVTDAGLAHLQKATKLNTLRVTGTDVSDEGVKLLQQALPDCKVVR